MTARHRCPGRCGRSLAIHVDICTGCARRDADLIARIPGPRRPTPCVSCGHAVAPGRTADGKTMCDYCENGRKT